MRFRGRGSIPTIMKSAPTVMVSSTFYDLKQIVGADLALAFISDELGYSALLSELPSFPVDPDLDTIENCRRRVERNADILVLVVGGRYGCDRCQYRYVDHEHRILDCTSEGHTGLCIRRETDPIHPSHLAKQSRWRLFECRRLAETLRLCESDTRRRKAYARYSLSKPQRRLSEHLGCSLHICLVRLSSCECGSEQDRFRDT